MSQSPVDEGFKDPKLFYALQNYVFDSGRLIVVELDDAGIIRQANTSFRARFSGYASVQGEPLEHFFGSIGGEAPEFEPGLVHRTPVARIFESRLGGEIYLFHSYPLDDGVLLIGELANMVESDVVERMGNIAMEMSRLVRELRKTNHDLLLANENNRNLALTDPLTGLANRRFFMERLAEGIERARATGQLFSLITLDLDHFKQINDRFGHNGGDAFLAAFAGLLRTQTREADLSARLGGEEFALLLADARLKVALEVAERLRIKAADLRPIDGVDYRLTASFGVVEYLPGENSDALLKRADDLLYKAKNRGRNRINGG